jgi:hypothetical protein
LSEGLPIHEVVEKRPGDIQSPVLATEMMGVLPDVATEEVV